MQAADQIMINLYLPCSLHFPSFGDEAWLAILEKTQHDSKWVRFFRILCPGQGSFSSHLVACRKTMTRANPPHAGVFLPLP